MSGEITAEFKTEDERKEFLSLFKDCSITDQGDHPYMCFKVDFENDQTIVYFNFNSFYGSDYHTSIGFEYKYGGCGNAFAYYLIYEVAQKYDVKIYWDGPVSDKFFDTYDDYHSGLAMADEFNKKHEPDYEDKYSQVQKESWMDMVNEIKRRENNLREICKGFFESNKFKQYIWE